VDYRNWILLFPTTFLLTSYLVLVCWPWALKQLPRPNPAEEALSYRYVGFLTQILYLVMLVPLWELVIYHHEHSLYWRHLSFARLSCSLGMSAGRVTAIYLTLTATGFCALSAIDLRQRDSANGETARRMALRRVVTHLCFAFALVSTDTIWLVVLSLIGFSLLGSARAGPKWHSYASSIALVAIAACAVWIAAMGGSSHPPTIRNGLPAISVLMLTTCFWITSAALLFHAVLSFCAAPRKAGSQVPPYIASISIWLVVDCFLFYRLLISLMPPWILTSAGL